MKPHGLQCNFEGRLLDNQLIKTESVLEAYINIENKNDKRRIRVPMRSFVNGFIDILYKLFSGAGGASTRKSSVSWSGSTARQAGIVVGSGTTPVVLSDDKLDSHIVHASVSYGQTTLITPYVVTGNPNQILTQIRKLISNNKTTSLIINELGVYGKAVGASSSSIAGRTLYSRDLITAPLDVSVSVPSGSSITFTFEFLVNQLTNGNGGLNLNFMKMLFNLFFKGNQNNPSSLLVNPLNQTINNYTYASSAVASSTAPWYLGGSSTQPYIGIIAGTRYSDEDRQDERENPPVGADERIMRIKNTLTYDANTISPIINYGTNEAQFTIARNITNNTANRILVNRIGLLIRGSGNGVTYNSSQVFIAINRIENTYLDPGQTYRAIYTFKIKA